ncbi:MAG: hypothetical protein M1834_007274 [Cirrosporium novae-zelandiae]|nr:MAG: hypothetical protein M1834_007274 [Cirrosporium novae-zelandiae]
MRPAKINTIGHMRDDQGRILLDNLGWAVKNFPMPSTFSTKVEGARMEAIIREDLRISNIDIRARMAIEPSVDGKDKRPGLSVIAMRRTRFRREGRLIAWEPRQDSARFVDKLEAELTGDMKRINTTRGMRNLTSGQIKDLVEEGPRNRRNWGQPSRDMRLPLSETLIQPFEVIDKEANEISESIMTTGSFEATGSFETTESLETNVLDNEANISNNEINVFDNDIHLFDYDANTSDEDPSWHHFLEDIINDSDDGFNTLDHGSFNQLPDLED